MEVSRYTYEKWYCGQRENCMRPQRWLTTRDVILALISKSRSENADGSPVPWCQRTVLLTGDSSNSWHVDVVIALNLFLLIKRNCILMSVDGVISYNLIAVFHGGDVKVTNYVTTLLSTPFHFLISFSYSSFTANIWNRKLTLAWSTEPVFIGKMLEDIQLVFVP